MKEYLKNHKIDRMEKGKPLTMASIVREAIFLWAEKNGVIDELKKFLEEK